MQAIVTIAQITDTHLFANPDRLLRGVCTWQSLQNILSRVKTLQPDVLLLTGDLADLGEPEAYDRLFECISPLQIPTYWLPGNHDNLAAMDDRLNRFPLYADKTFTIGGWQFLLLDSTLETAKFGEGYLSRDTLNYLETALQDSDRPTAIALHHHSLPVGIDWVDTIGVSNAEEFLKIVDRFDRVKLVLCGHVHLECDRRHHRIRFCTTPSTCTQVMPENATERDRDPGFRWFELHPDGTYQTRVIRVRNTTPTIVR